MKKLIVGAVAVGAVMALRPALKHCRQMMSGSGCGPAGHEAMHQKMREHCGPRAEQHEEPAEPVGVV